MCVCVCVCVCVCLCVSVLLLCKLSCMRMNCYTLCNGARQTVGSITSTPQCYFLYFNFFLLLLFGFLAAKTKIESLKKICENQDINKPKSDVLPLYSKNNKYKEIFFHLSGVYSTDFSKDV